MKKDKNQILASISLSLTKYIGTQLYLKLIQKFDNPLKVFDADNHSLLQLGVQRSDMIKSILEKKTWTEAEKIYHNCQKYDISIITLEDENYPYLLRQCSDAPIILYYKGVLPSENHTKLSIVGTRNATGYGRKTLEKWMQNLSSYPIHVISGLALGIDQLAHTYALEHKIKTSAILANGLDTIYPKENRTLANEILDKGGALISETPPEKKLLKEYFPRRNRIIAGYSPATWVVESAKSGGSLITAQMAFDYNREVLALVGRVSDTTSEGCHLLIKKNIASTALEFEDLISALKMKEIEHPQFGSSQKKENIPTDAMQLKVYQYLRQQGAKHPDELSTHLNTSIQNTLTCLTMMEIDGFITLTNDGNYDLEF